MLPAVLAGCGKATFFTRPKSSASTTPPSGWTGPNAADLGAVDSSLVNLACIAADTGSFYDFKLARSSSQAALTTTACLDDGATDVTRVLTRFYNPYSLGGSGWEPFGLDSALIDAVSTATPITDVVAAYSPGGDGFLSAFWGSTAASAQSALHVAGGGWGSFESSFSGAAMESALDLFHNDGYPGTAKDLTWDIQGDAYAAFPIDNSNEGEGRIFRYSGGTWSFRAVVTDLMQQVRLIDDGIGVTAIIAGQNDIDNGTGMASIEEDGTCPLGLCMRLKTAWSQLNGFQTVTRVSSADAFAANDGAGETNVSGYYPDVQGFDAAADGEGNVVVVFLQKSPNFVGTCDADADNCQWRVFASYRTGAGVWTGPMQIDGELQPLTTTYYHASILLEDGRDFVAPTITYVGDGYFLAAFTAIDVTDATDPRAKVYVRGFTVGGGWDLPPAGLTEPVAVVDVRLQKDGGTFGTDLYRPINYLSISGDGEGNALLIVRQTLSYKMSAATTAASISDWNYGYTVWRYSMDTGWATPLRVFDAEARECDARSITTVTAATAAVVTTRSAHGLSSGEQISILGSNTTPTIDGTRTVTVLSDTTFTVPVTVTTGGELGTWVKTSDSAFYRCAMFGAPATFEDLAGTACSSSATAQNCMNARPEGAIFPGGEAVAVLPMPGSSGEGMRLYTVEYVP
jgi:hypothetical protein